MSDNNFDKIAEKYSDIHKKSLQCFSEMDIDYFTKYKLDIVQRELNFSPRCILDFGCGIGLSSGYMSKIFPSAFITGIDTSTNSIANCNKLKINNSLFYSIDISKEPLPNNKNYDLIFAACVFHHLDKKIRKIILSNLIDNIEKEGCLYIFEHNPLNPITSFIFKNSEIDKDCSMMSAHELKNIFTELNRDDAKIISTNYTIFLPRYKCISKLFDIEKYLTKFPIGCQYYTVIKKLA